MKIADITRFLETLAPPSLQEHYDNAGLITGHPSWKCKGILCTLDATEEVIREAISRNCNLVIAHHPIVFGGLKKINGKNYVEQTVITAIKNDIAIYAIHTNLDNMIAGVNGKIAAMLKLQNITILQPRENTLRKLITFVPAANAGEVRNAMFGAGGGHIGRYSECSFNEEGMGTFKAGDGATPYVGEKGIQHQENEIKIEMVVPAWLENQVITAMKAAHPYEEVAFDLIPLSNPHQGVGAGITGMLPDEMPENEFLALLKELFEVPVIKHSTLLNRPVKKVALCGGAGSFLISKALAAGADAYITADLKYHDFFEANNRLLIADIGHYESEQYTTALLADVLGQKFPNFAVLKTGVKTNPVQYFM